MRTRPTVTSNAIVIMNETVCDVSERRDSRVIATMIPTTARKQEALALRGPGLFFIIPIVGEISQANVIVHRRELEMN
jgi:hypothetical protein